MQEKLKGNVSLGKNRDRGSACTCASSLLLYKCTDVLTGSCICAYILSMIMVRTLDSNNLCLTG